MRAMMVTGIIGKKIGMTQLFDQGGRVRPATGIKAGPSVVVQAKTVARDGYEAVQLGLVEERPARVTSPIAGHFKKADLLGIYTWKTIDIYGEKWKIHPKTQQTNC